MCTYFGRKNVFKQTKVDKILILTDVHCYICKNFHLTVKFFTAHTLVATFVDGL